MTNDAPDLIAAYNSGRDPARLAMKLKAMRDNPFSFFRGAAHLFYARLTSNAGNPGGPSAWLCGDLHLENFGTYLGSNGLTYFDVNDFDETALAPCTWDILRLATSLLVAAPQLKIERSAAVTLAGDAIERYRSELSTGKPRWIERRTADGVIGDLIDGLKHRDTDKFIAKRTTGKQGNKLDTASGKALAVTDPGERKDVKDFTETLTTGEDGQDRYTFLDAAYRIAGTGSLGIPRFVVLAERTPPQGGKHKVLLDLKFAAPSCLKPLSPVPQPDWTDDAERIVSVQTQAQAIPPALLRPVALRGRPFVLKELQPTADRLNLAAVAKDASAFASAVSSMACLTAWSQLRLAGRRNASSPDTLTDFAAVKSNMKPLLSTAKALERTTRTDWKRYCDAFDAGAYGDVLAATDATDADAEAAE